SEEDGALVWALLGYGVIVIACWRLASAAWGPSGGALAAFLLLCLAPLRDAAASAWSETVAIGLWAWAVAGLVPRAEGRSSTRRAFAGGALLGLAFATRYALWPAVPVCMLALTPWRSGLRPALRFGLALGAGALAPALLVLGRNARMGMLLGEPRG